MGSIGPKFALQDFAIFCPKVLAGIGLPPDTVTDRSITIRLKRKRRDQHLHRFRRRLIEQEAAELHGRAQQWASEVVEPLRDAWPVLPDELDDRAQDNWEPLLAIADVIGGDWPERGRAAAKVLSAAGVTEDDSLPIRLLSDIRDVFQSKERIFSEDLVVALNAIETSPWAEFGRGSGVSKVRVARLLHDFGIRPKQIRIGTATKQGYEYEAFQDAFLRYLPDTEVEPATSTTSRMDTGIAADLNPLHAQPCSTSGDVADPHEQTDVARVVDESPEGGADNNSSGLVSAVDESSAW